MILNKNLFLLIFSLLFSSMVCHAIKIVAKADVGSGNAVFISGSSEGLGKWRKAYRLNNKSPNTWEYEGDIPVGTEFKFLKAEWHLGGGLIPVDRMGADCGFEIGENHIVSNGTITLMPKFENRIYSSICLNVAEAPGKNINFYNAGTHKCLGYQNADDNANVASDCTFNDSQIFAIEEIGDKVYNIKNQKGYCLEVVGNSKLNGARVHMAKCTGADNQKIAFSQSSNDVMYRKIIFVHSDKCLDVVADPKRPFQQWACNDKLFYQDFYINRKVKSDTLTHIVWTFWDKGEAEMPAFYKANVKHWNTILNQPSGKKNWNIRVLNDNPTDENYYGNFVKKETLPSPEAIQSRIGTAEFEKKLKKAVIFSDFIRLEVLYEHGGVWLDPSIMLHEPLNDIEAALQMADFSVAGYTSRFQGTSRMRYADSLENFFIMALPKSKFIKVWKENFRQYWNTKKPNVAIENHPMYNGSSGNKVDLSQFGKLKDYLNQHAALKYTLEKNPSLLTQVFVIGGANEDEKGPFTLLNLVSFNDENLLNLPVSKFDEYIRKMQGVIMSKFPSEDSVHIRQIKDVNFFFNKGNFLGRLNS